MVVRETFPVLPWNFSRVKNAFGTVYKVRYDGVRLVFTVFKNVCLRAPLAAWEVGKEGGMRGENRLCSSDSGR
jgi:hypothetical protein